MQYNEEFNPENSLSKINPIQSIQSNEEIQPNKYIQIKNPIQE